MKWVFCGFLCILLVPTVLGATVNIDGSAERQTIDGLGGSESILFPQTDNDFDLLFTDLGVSILRMNLRTFIEDNESDQGNASYNDNDDPNVIDWNRVNTYWIDYLADKLPVKAKDRGVNQFFWSISTPPSWMKEGGTLQYSGGRLKPENYAEFAEYMVIWYKGLRDRKGINLTYICLQNEPDGGGNPTWGGTTYTGEELRDLIKVVGPRFQAEGITAKIVLPESVSLENFPGLATPTLQDPLARQYLGLLATHEYEFEWEWLDAKPDDFIDRWINAANLARQYNITLWMSEHNNGKVDWQGGLRFVQHIHNALVYGNVSAWLFHELYEPTRWGESSPGAGDGGFGGLITEYGPWPRFYWLKNYFRYVRPGAIRIEAQSDDSDILVTSFKQNQSGNFTIVAINRKVSDEVVIFNISNIQNLSELDVIRTSSTENSSILGNVSVSNNSFVYTLPRESVTTFAGRMGAAQPVPGDINNDKIVDIFDLNIVAINFGQTSVNPLWNVTADVVANNEIDIYDVVFVASRFT